MRIWHLFGILLLLDASTLCAQDSPWPGQFFIQPWEHERLRPTDVIGPDGIVYPDVRPAGVQGGIPEIDDRYQRFDVTDPAYGADGSDQALDGAAVSAAIEAAMAYLRAGEGRRACVYFPAGDYRFDEPLPAIGLDDEKTPIEHLVLQGAGPERTTLTILEGSSYGQLITFKGDDVGPFLHLRQTVGRGGNVLPVEETLPEDHYQVGEWIRVKPTELPVDSTMAIRCNRPEAAVIYEAKHLGRTYYGRITERSERSLTIDHHLLHDLYADERPQVRCFRMVAYCGVQDLRIATVSAECRLDPLLFDATANCWMRNVHIDQPRNWPVRQNGLTHHEYRDCHFDGTLIPLNGGGRAYLGWTGDGITHSLMIDCQANDLRHMPIFQHSAGCVVTGSRFSGDTTQALLCHGSFPHDIVIDDCDFDVPGLVVAIDGTHTLRHGLEGPRFVMHHNRVAGTYGLFDINGGVEGHIYVYNRVRLDDAGQHFPALSLRDRSWDGIFRGNVLSVSERSPLVNIEDPTCPGWTITDNRVYGSNGRIWEGSSRPRLAAGNRFHPTLANQSDLPLAKPATDSLYDWQLQHAHRQRLLLVAPARDAAAGGMVDLVLMRIADTQLPEITVQLASADPAWGAAQEIELAAGQRVHRFQLPVPETLAGAVTVAVSADGYLSDEEFFQVIDPFVPPDRGQAANDLVTALADDQWRAGDFGGVSVAGSQSFDGDRITLRGNGGKLTTSHSHLGRSGFHFVYQALNGDGGMIARLVSMEGADQAGIRWLDDEATTTEHLHLFSDGQVLASPILSSFNTAELHPDLGLSPPVWLKLERQGAHFYAWYATTEAEPADGEWIAIDLDEHKGHDHIDWWQDPADPDYDHLTDDYKSLGVIDDIMYFGLFVNQDSGQELGTAVFEGVRFFGEVLPPGNVTGRQISVQVSGAGATPSDISVIHRQSGSSGQLSQDGSTFPALPPQSDALFQLFSLQAPEDFN